MTTENKTETNPTTKKKAGRPPKEKPTETMVPQPIKQPTPIEMLNKLVDAGANAEQLQILFNLHQEWEQSQARKEYIAAMNLFKANPPEIKKSRHVQYQNKDGSWTDYWHSDLDDIVSGASPELAKHGLDMHWETDQGEGGRIKVSCVLTHFMGHTKTVSLYGSPDQSGGKNNIQAVGSTVKYLQRYTAMAVLGLSDSDIDNDGSQGQITQDQEPDQQADELPPYPADMLAKNMPKWKKLLADNKDKTPDGIVKTISTKYKLTDEQKNQIMNIQTTEASQ